MEPVQDRRVRDAGLGQDGPHAGAAVGERGQLGVAGATHGVEGAPDQRHDVGAGVREGAEQLPAAPGRLGVADPHLQVPFALVAAPDERCIQAEGDRGRCGRIHGVRLDRGGITQSLTELERMTTQGPVARSGRDWQQVG